MSKDAIYPNTLMPANMTESKVDLAKYTYLVRGIANRFSAISKAEFDDLYQEGMMGLWRAGQKFDETRGVKFPTYARFFIRMYMQRYVNTKLRLIRIPHHVEYDMFRETKKNWHKYAKTGIMPQSELYNKHHTSYVSMDSIITDDSGTMHEILKDDNVASLQQYKTRMAIRDLVDRAYEDNVINYREYFILNSRMSDKTLQEIGADMHVTRQRIEQLNTKAEGKIRAYFKQLLSNGELFND